ncbi:leukocyte elastase inhibitor-like isoform X2 [Oppia nitens]|nr:leukocyte elastase inhibitor-like isoform X2 [Oppia nitens]
MTSQLDTGSLDFALAVSRELVNQDSARNLVFSPFSLSTALTMTLMGSRGRTGEELSRVLLGKSYTADGYKSLANEYHSLVDRVLKANSGILLSANYLYAHKSYPIRKDYRQMIEQSFAGKARDVDFEGQPQSAVKTINSDVSDATKGKIKTLFDDIDSATKLILVNALYFKGLWKTPFKTKDTKPRKFTTARNDILDVPTMHQKVKVPFMVHDDLNLSAIELTYDKSNCAMLILLPNTGVTLESMIGKLTAETLSQIVGSLTPQKLDIYLPKFKLESILPLIPTLTHLGIQDIFNSEVADFSAMTSDPMGLYVGEVLQKAVIEVNEEGTEAAAATSVAMMARSMDFPESFEANRPFMFLLVSKYEPKKSTLLFAGIVNNPLTA